MTSNAGTRELAERRIGFAGGSKGDGKREVERLFSPEFRNRLDEVVWFRNLTPDVMGRVVDKFVTELEQQLAARKVTITLGDGARAWLAERGYDAEFGARPLARVIQTEVKDRISDEMLFGQLVAGGRVEVGEAEGALTFAFTPRG
jgi:ATP-dependent Clp protease ATP-binding subunit ClpA